MPNLRRLGRGIRRAIRHPRRAVVGVVRKVGREVKRTVNHGDIKKARRAATGMISRLVSKPPRTPADVPQPADMTLEGHADLAAALESGALTWARLLHERMTNPDPHMREWILAVLPLKTWDQGTWEAWESLGPDPNSQALLMRSLVDSSLTAGTPGAEFTAPGVQGAGVEPLDALLAILVVCVSPEALAAASTPTSPLLPHVFRAGLPATWAAMCRAQPDMEGGGTGDEGAGSGQGEDKTDPEVGGAKDPPPVHAAAAQGEGGSEPEPNPPSPQEAKGADPGMHDDDVEGTV